MERTSPLLDMTGSSQRGAEKTAGLMFLLCFIAPTLNWTLLLSNLNVAGNALATAENIAASDLLFRVGIAVELLLAVGLVVLAVALYSILETVSRMLALLALAWKIVEAGLVAVLVLLSLTTLLTVHGEPSIASGASELWRAPAGLLLNNHTVLYGVPMVFLGMNMTLFFYLFFKSNAVPKVMAVFGILSFVLIFVHAMGHIVAPTFASNAVVQAVFYTPSCFIELVMGFWLLTKGIDGRAIRTSDSPGHTEDVGGEVGRS